MAPKIWAKVRNAKRRLAKKCRLEFLGPSLTCAIY